MLNIVYYNWYGTSARFKTVVLRLFNMKMSAKHPFNYRAPLKVTGTNERITDLTWYPQSTDH